ncbi:MAG: exodeoxyribonuclease III [Pelagibacterales bacterium]|nr:exodeoxyribonuclease III [Pelagibacterales bacterium]
MKIISWNVNGIRSVHKKGFLEWFKKTKADIVCLQETKAQKEQIPDDLINLKNYYFYSNQAVKKGYSGVAVWTKQLPIKVDYKLGLKRFDQEGRILKLEYPDFTLINLYLPHGGRNKENLAYKLECYTKLLSFLKKTKNTILVGDFNIAHQEIDLARPGNNKNNIMFTPEERKQIDNLISLGFTDTFRKFNQKPGNYTWWPYFVNARDRNLGWRIDYCFTSKGLSIKDAFILNKVKGSDHCPIGINVG